MPFVSYRPADVVRDPVADAPINSVGASVLLRWRTHRGPRGPRGPRGHRAPVGALFPWLTVGPTLAATAWLLVSLPLLLAGQFRAPFAVALFVPVFGGLVLAAARLVPPMRAPAWSVLLVVATGVAFTAIAAAGHAEQILVRRDAGSYAQFSHWLSGHGALPVPGDLARFGGPDPALSLDSPAFFEHGDTVVPQFMAGFPLTAAVAVWLGGWTGLLVAPAVLGGLAVVAMGGLTARLVGPRWAPLGALGLALAFPVLHASKATYSEPLALLLTLAALYLLSHLTGDGPDDRGTDGDAEALPGGAGAPGGGGAARWLAGLAGLPLGLVMLVRIDSGREVALTLPMVGWLLLGRAVGDRRRAARALPLAAGLAVGVAYGLVDGAVFSRPYLDQLRPSLVEMATLGAVTFVLTAVAVTVAWRLRRPAPPRRWLDRSAVAAGAGVALVGVLLVLRPHLQTAHGVVGGSSVRWLAALQHTLGLPVDGTRSYDEDSLYWVAWYLGWPLVVAGFAGAAVLTRRVWVGRERRWAAVLPVLLGSTALVLVRPGIMPDQPWASRRLAVTVMPAVVLFGLWTAARATDCLASLHARGRRRGYALARSATVLAVAGAVAACAVPAALATAPLALPRTEVGQVGAVERACAAFGPGDVALMVDERASGEWSQALRGGCGVPTATVTDVTPATVARLAARARAAGGKPVLVSGEEHPDALTGLGLRATEVALLDTTEDTHELLRAADRRNPLVDALWTAPAPAGG